MARRSPQRTPGEKRAARRCPGGPSLSDASAALSAHGVTSEVLTQRQFVAEITERERTPRNDVELTRACIEALRGRGVQFPSVPGARVVRGWSPNGTPPPPEWGVPIVRGEAPIAFAMLGQPWVGYVSIVARAADLPRPGLDGAARDRIASALVDAVLAEVRR